MPQNRLAACVDLQRRASIPPIVPPPSPGVPAAFQQQTVISTLGALSSLSGNLSHHSAHATAEVGIRDHGFTQASTSGGTHASVKESYMDLLYYEDHPTQMHDHTVPESQHDHVFMSSAIDVGSPFGQMQGGLARLSTDQVPQAIDAPETSHLQSQVRAHEVISFKDIVDEAFRPSSQLTNVSADSLDHTHDASTSNPRGAKRRLDLTDCPDS